MEEDPLRNVNKLFFGAENDQILPSSIYEDDSLISRRAGKSSQMISFAIFFVE